MKYTIELWLNPQYASWMNDAEYCRVYHITDTELYKFLNALSKAVGKSFNIWWDGDGATITLPIGIKELPEACQLFI